MSCTLNQPAFQQLIDEDIEWLLQQPRSLEREHIEMCLRSYREIPPHVIEELYEKYPISKAEK